jgi:hypothetical protein
MEGYNAKVTYISKDIPVKEKIKLKDTSNAISLDTATAESPLVIDPDYYAVVEVHNEKSEDKDYKKYVIVDTDGNKFVTGSESFITAFREIADDMANEAPGEGYSIQIYRKPSANYKGKEFITCSLV